MALIHILDKQSDKIIGTLNLGEYTDDEKVSENENTFDFTALKKFDILQKRNRLLLQDRDGFFSEFLIVYAEQNSRNQKFIKSNATFTDLQKAKIIEPQTLQGATADTATTKALEGTEWRKGKVDYNGIRTLKIEEYTNPYNLLKRIASEFGLDLRFRVAVEGNKIVRYVDLTLPDDEFDGKEVVFGKDLIGLRRIEDAQNIVTALLVLGPEQDGKRLTVLVEDNDALQRWGRNGQHLIEVYEPQITVEEVTVERLRTLGQNALQKRIDALVTYECQAAVLEHITGKEHEKVRLDMTIRIKDDGYTPPLYLEAKVLEIKEQPSTGKILDFKLGNYKEFSKADLEAQIAGLKKQLNDKLSKLVQVSVTSSAGTVFKNGTGETDLTAVTILGGKEVDTDGLFYNYVWSKYDKNGNFVGATSGKSITVYARNIDEKETYIVTVENEGAKSIGQITVTNVNDGAQGPPGQDGKSSYTHLAYANSADGRTDFSLTDSNREYIGMYVDDSPTNSTDPAKYKWTLVKGADGAQGIQGPPGADGRTPYLHIAYANSADGRTGFSTTDSANKLYIGQYTDFSPADSTDPAKYSWTLIKGDKGEQGPAGKGVSSIQEQYYLSTSNTAQTGGSWANTPPAWVDGRYMWTRSTITYTDGTTVTTDPVCVTGAKGPTGETGTGIQSVDVMYYLSTSATTLSGGSWSTTAPTWVDGKYMWSKTVTSYTNGTTVESTPACITGAKGATGAPGRSVTSIVEEYYYSTSPTAQVGGSWSTTYPSYQEGKYLWTRAKTTFSDGETSYTTPVCVTGTKGADGVTTYTWVKYADDDRGNGMSDSPNGKRYLGLAYNKTTATESTNPADYSWSPLYDNVKVGGRNLLRNSNDFTNLGKHSGAQYSYKTGVAVSEWNATDATEIHVTGGNSAIKLVKPIVKPSVAGQEYTLSVWVKNIGEYPVIISANIPGKEETVNPGESKRVIVSGKGNGNSYFQLNIKTLQENMDKPLGFIIWRCQGENGNVATDWAPAPEDVQAAIDQAKEDAQNAQSTADGKNTVFYQASAPSTVGRKVNDLWYDTDDGYKPYRFDGSNWVAAPFGNAAIANLDVGKIVGDQGNFNWLEAKHIKSLNGLNVGNGQFVVDANGNVKFAGNLEGASGTFGEVTVKDGDFYLKDTKSGIRYSLVKKTNILGDHSFELIKLSDPTSQDNIDHWWLPIITDNTNWETIGAPRGVPISIAGPGPADAMPIFGNRAILVNSTNYIEQPVWDVTANTQYTFSVHAKRPYNNTPGAVRLEVHYKKYNTDGTSTRQLVAAQSFDTVASDYSVSRHALTFTSPNVARTGSDEIIFVIKGVNANWVHVDGVQVVKSAYPTVYDTEDSLWSFMNSRNGFKARAIWTEGIYNGVNGIDIDDNRIRIYSNESLNYFSVENIESRFSTVPYDQWKDPEPNVKKSIKVNGGIATDGLYVNAWSISKNAIATNGKIYVGGEGIELAWAGGTPYIDFTRRSGVDFDMRLILETDSGLAIRSSDNIVRHKFYANGTKSGGSIEVDGKNLGMSPIDSPQVLLETIEFDVPLTEQGTKVLLDSRFAKAVNYRFAVFPNNGRVIEKGPDYFIIAGTGTADIRIIGERVGYAGVYFDDMTMEGVV